MIILYLIHYIIYYKKYYHLIVITFVSQKRVKTHKSEATVLNLASYCLPHHRHHRRSSHRTSHHTSHRIASHHIIMTTNFTTTPSTPFNNHQSQSQQPSPYQRRNMFEGVGAPVKLEAADPSPFDDVADDPTLDSCCQREVSHCREGVGRWTREMEWNGVE